MPILSSCGIKWNKAQKNLLLKGRHPLNVSLLEIAWDKIITNTLQLRAFSPVRSIQFHSVQLLSHVRLFAIPWTSACQASLSITDSWSLLKFMSIKSVMPFNHLILCCPFLLLPSIFPTSGSFQMSQFFASVQFSHSVVSNSLWPHGLQHARLPCPSPTPGACWNSCPSSWWCHLTISSSVVPFSSCLQSFPASGSFFKWVSSSHQVAKVLEFQLQHQSFQWIFRKDFL